MSINPHFNPKFKFVRLRTPELELVTTLEEISDRVYNYSSIGLVPTTFFYPYL